MNMALKLGDRCEILNLKPELNTVVLQGKSLDRKKSEQEIVLEALETPINSETIRKIVSPGDSVCIILSDITRLWQKQYVFLPIIIRQLNEAGILDKDIKLLCSTGSHRIQTEAEHNQILGPELCGRFKIIDHDCRNEENLLFVGTTTYGTPVLINKLAVNCNHLILTGGIVFHDMAGFGGGRKSILPGVCGYRTIMSNHALSLNHEEGKGCNPNVRSGFLENNPFHLDMAEAAHFVKASFLLNVITDSEGNISHAVAGHYIDAHEYGCNILRNIDSVQIHEKADMVIASCGGYPKDIDLYQASKTLSNAREAAREGGTIIILAQCREGFGHSEVKKIISNHTSNMLREKEVRREYTIAKYTGYLICAIAEKHKVILVSEMPKDNLSNIDIEIVPSLEEAVDAAYSHDTSIKNVYILPSGANTLPTLTTNIFS
jgi:lactate racemase